MPSKDESYMRYIMPLSGINSPSAVPLLPPPSWAYQPARLIHTPMGGQGCGISPPPMEHKVRWHASGRHGISLGYIGALLSVLPL